MDIQPRSLGEICDDAWRSALADAPLLLLFNTLFMVPAFLVLLLLLAQPVPIGMAQGILPALAALLLPLMGLASGACQELFRQRLTRQARGRLVGLLALRRSLEHAAARAVLLCFTLPGPLLLLLSFLPDTSPILRFMGFLFGSLLTFLLSLPLWSACTSLHVLLSEGADRSGTLLRELRRDVAAAAGKSAVLVLSRIPLLLFLVLQLHLFAKVVLWAADNLGGFDTSLLDVQLALFEEPIYTLVLFLLSWLLLSPFFEAGNFHLHIDIRTRQEGLDLQYRVQRAFRVRSSEPRPLGSSLPRSLTVAALICLIGGSAVRAEEAQRETIRAICGEIETIRAEIQKTDPYPGGQRWQDRLRRLQTKLAQSDGGPRRFRWYEQAIDDFADRKKEDALRILDDLQRRLSLLEESLSPPHQPAAQAQEKRSPEDVKSMLRSNEGGKTQRNPARPRIEEDRHEVRREEDREKEQQDAPQADGSRGMPVSVPAARGSGLSTLGWLLLGGLALAVLVVGILLYLTSPQHKRANNKPRAGSVSDGRSVIYASGAFALPQESPAALWRQADTLAGDGRFLEAVRVLYLAVLALLDRQRLIRFEPTRTNGEYVRQVRLSEQAPPELHEPFEQLTQLFETAWYGERPCEDGAYRAFRTLADGVQHVAVRV